MTRVDLHPDELFDRLRTGCATATERARLHAHLKSCSACRLEQALLDDADEAAAAPAAAEVAERARRRALSQLLAQRGIKKNGRFRLRRRSVLLLAAALSAACFAAVAVGRTRARVFGPSAPQSSAHVAAIGKPPAALPSAPDPSNTAAVSSSRSPDTDANKPTGAAARSPETSSASELFAHANQARHQGNAREAAALYRSLERSFPKSAEASVARVAFGRLLLDRLSDPRAALGEFDAYLASGRALREEALVGRALSLGRLGRGKEEKASWAALLAAFPQSTYAERAKERISELD